LFLKEPPRGAKEESLEEILEKDPSLSFQYKIKPEDIKYLWKRRTNLFLVPNLVDNIPGGILATYGVSWLVRIHGLSQDDGLVLFVFVGILSLIGTIGFAKYGDRRAKTDRLIRVKLGILLSIASVPFILIAVNIPWFVGPDVDLIQILLDPLVLIVILLIGIGLTIDSGIYPNWMSAITEINLPEQRSTMISLANFFDACGRGLGILIGAIILIITPGNFTFVMSIAVIFTLFSFIWWVPAMKTYNKDYEEVKKILEQRSKDLQVKIKK
jgi:MFS family permease